MSASYLLGRLHSATSAVASDLSCRHGGCCVGGGLRGGAAVAAWERTTEGGSRADGVRLGVVVRGVRRWRTK